MFDEIIKFIRELYPSAQGNIALHEPLFNGNEKKYLEDCIDSTFVSSVGQYVGRFEQMLQEYTGADYAIATSNGTAALHIALLAAGVKPGEIVITQPLTFIATCNAVAYSGAQPLFVDVNKNTLGLSAEKLYDFLNQHTFMNDEGECLHKTSGKRIAACLPMHTFGHPCDMESIMPLCNQFNIPVIEDAAESIGSLFKGRHTGTFGLCGTLSFNGNKTITCGGGGAIITSNPEIGKLAKHLTTQAKVPHNWDFYHDITAYNYRMPNINAALACAQMEQLQGFLEDKRHIAGLYKAFFSNTPFTFIDEPENARSNFWLNAILLNGPEQRNEFLKITNSNGIMTRPAWKLMPDLPMYKNSLSENIDNARFIEERLVNLPSSVRKS
jgi:aminotransferase in exopolysaccharide biosynthesis